MIGRIFDIKEMTVHDGSGIRITVFMKGCPLRCEWCHNPEGLSFEKNLFYKHTKCIKCGLCYEPCNHEDCKPFGRCLHICPNDCLSVVGQDYDSEHLVKQILTYKTLLNDVGGGVTFSGGEPLYQWQFLSETIDKLKQNGIHDIAIETCGFADSKIFSSISRKLSMVIMDIKLFDKDEHIYYTKRDNKIIKENFVWLKASGIPYIVRTPLIQGITSTNENLSAIKAFIGDSTWELLPENYLAKMKHGMLVR
jgi:pyruvate formate lyase activating enzyme